MATFLVSIWRQRLWWECVINNPRGTVKVTADVMTRCRSAQQKAGLCDKARKHSISMYILFKPLRLPHTWGGFCSITEVWREGEWPWKCCRGSSFIVISPWVCERLNHCPPGLRTWLWRLMRQWENNPPSGLCLFCYSFFRPDSKYSENVGGEDGF